MSVLLFRIKFELPELQTRNWQLLLHQLCLKYSGTDTRLNITAPRYGNFNYLTSFAIFLSELYFMP